MKPSSSNSSPSALSTHSSNQSSSKGDLLGSVGLVAGTTVGAGVLALPAVTMPVGFWPSTVLMLGAWLYMVASGLLIAEANLQARTQAKTDDLGLLATVNLTLGKWGAIASAIVYIFIHYALLIAYIARGGDILAAAITQIGHWLHILETVPLWWGHIIFAFLFANLLFWGSYLQ